MIIMVMGLPGSGKSYFASQLAALLNAEYINSDRVRWDILREATYSDREKRMVYVEMLERAANAAEAGNDVVLDATFYRHKLREAFTLALEGISRMIWIEIVADEDLIRDRLGRPRQDSDANFEVYRELREEWEPFTAAHLVLRSTNENIDGLLDQALEYLHGEIYE